MSQEDAAQGPLASVEDLFHSPPKRRYKRITLPVSGHTVRIRSLTELELSRYQAAVISSSGQGVIKDRLVDANCRLLVLCLVDGEGNQMLTNKHLGQLLRWDGADTAYLYQETAKHVGVNSRDLDDLAKNSAAIDVEDSPSSSPSE